MHLIYDGIVIRSTSRRQKINISNATNVDFLYIYNKSNVIFECSPQSPRTEKIKLLIYDDPNITFLDDCNFNFIKIYGSPTFKISSNANLNVENVFIYNHSYQLPFKAENILYSPNETRKQIKSNSDYFYNYSCQNIEFSLSILAFIFCDQKIVFASYYDELYNYNFRNINEITFEKSNVNEKYMNSYLSLILTTLSLKNVEKVTFIDFLNMSYLNMAINVLKSTGAQIIMSFNWRRYIIGNAICPWDDEDITYYSSYKYLKDYFNELEDKYQWRKVCIGTNGYLYLQNEEDIETIVFSSVKSWSIIIGCLLLIIAMLITCILIAYYRYTHEQKKEN